MTKDWDAVRPTIRHLSVDEKKCLQDVKTTMEKKHNFRASTRAYRMKLKEWGYLRHKPRKHAKENTDFNEDGPDRGSESESPDSSGRSTAAALVSRGVTLEEEVQDLISTANPWPQGPTSTILMEMLDTILAGDSQKLEEHLMAHPDQINQPVGLPFDDPNSRFFNHPAIQQCVMLQHPGQTLLDIASALPIGPVVWVMITYGAEGSTHPLGTELSLQNAIKNGRTNTVRCLLSNRPSMVNGKPGTLLPLQQAVLWNFPDIVRCLLDKGATVNVPPLDRGQFKTALQLALNQRTSTYSDLLARERNEKVLKLLLDAGADIHVPPVEDWDCLSFEMFIRPWKEDPMWWATLSPTARECLEAFIRKGADLRTPFTGFPCPTPSGNTFVHQMLWHTMPSIARLVVDSAVPSPEANGSKLLHEIVGCCPHAKRHPADTLRDIDVLLTGGADPNLIDEHGTTPLTSCIERCPGIDLISCLTALLEGGADPELRDANSLHPTIFAARSLGHSLLSQVMELLLSKFRGRRSNPDNSSWVEGFLPIPKNPSFVQVLKYSGNPDFEASMQQMLPEDVVPIFRAAAFSTASKNYLDSLTKRTRRNSNMPLTANEKDEIEHLMRLRQDRSLPHYKFDQDFVMALFMSNSIANHQPVQEVTMSDASGSHTHLYEGISASPSGISLTLTPSLESITSLPMPLTMNHEPTEGRRESTSSTNLNNSSASFFVPTTTQIRWPSIERAPRPGDLEEATAAVLQFSCKSCIDGPELTAAEYKRHEDEHWHTIACCEVGCKRRFCDAERG